jgi:hypothetical protein
MPSAARLIRWAGVPAMLAGISYAVVGVFHPSNVLPSATTTAWITVHVIALGLSFFGLLGLTGLYARQAERAGWLGLAGYLLFSLWLVLMMGFFFVEIFVLPVLATVAPTFAMGFLGMFNGSASEIDLGALPMVWQLSGPIYILGGLLFGIATFRAGILPRWAGVLLAAGTAIAPLAALLPLEHQPKVAVPVGLALIWLGYSLVSERPRAATSLAATGTAGLREAEAL